MHFNIPLAGLVALLLPVQMFAASGALTVTQTMSAHASVPKGASRVPFLTLQLAVSCDAAVTIGDVTVVHEGLGLASDIERLYVMDGRQRLTRSRLIDEQDLTSTLRFIPALKLAACEKRTVVVMGDIAADAANAGEHRLSLELPTDIQTDATVTLQSGSSDVGSAVVRPQTVGTVTAQILSLTQPLRFGKNRTLARFRLEADSEANQHIHSITLTNEGKATDTDLKNLRIVNRRGQTLTETRASMDGGTVTLTFDPMLALDRNDEIALELKGDITASRRRTIRFVIEEPSDIDVTPRTR